MFWRKKKPDRPKRPTVTFEYDTAGEAIQVFITWPDPEPGREMVTCQALAKMLYHVLAGSMNDTVVRTLPVAGETQGEAQIGQTAAAILSKALEEKFGTGNRAVVRAIHVFSHKDD